MGENVKSGKTELSASGAQFFIVLFESEEQAEEVCSYRSQEQFTEAVQKYITEGRSFITFYGELGMFSAGYKTLSFGPYTIPLKQVDRESTFWVNRPVNKEKLNG